MAENNDNKVDGKNEITGSKIPRWGCLLVVLMIIALFVIIFFYGQFAAIPNSNDGAGP